MACYITRRDANRVRHIVCTECDQPVERAASRAGRAARQFCSRPCYDAYRRAHPEEHPRYAGGREPYYGPDWREQAKHTRNRDGHTCQDCGLTQISPLLDVHHVIPRRAFNGDYIAANNLGNLITLCRSCHANRERATDAVYRCDPVAATAHNRPDRQVRGSAHKIAKLTEDDVRWIAALLQDGRSKASLARDFSVSEGTIYHIAAGRNWNHITNVQQRI